MDLSGNGHALGRVYISVFGHIPHGEQFIKLILGIEGPTFKGATFWHSRSDNHIAVREYIDERGWKRHTPLITLNREFEAPRL